MDDERVARTVGYLFEMLQNDAEMRGRLRASPEFRREVHAAMAGAARWRRRGDGATAEWTPAEAAHCIACAVGGISPLTIVRPAAPSDVTPGMVALAAKHGWTIEGI